MRDSFFVINCLKALSRGALAGSRPSCLSTIAVKRDPLWWWYFEQLGMSPEELVDDSESIGCLEPDPLVPPEGRKKSLVHTLRFPAQDHKLGPGRVYDPATGENAGEILEINDATGMLKLLRGPKLT